MKRSQKLIDIGQLFIESRKVVYWAKVNELPWDNELDFVMIDKHIMDRVDAGIAYSYKVSAH